MKKPLVSILIPVHNSDKYLKDCLRSIKRQTYKNIEIIAIDDRSNDESYKILRTLKKNLPAGRQGSKRIRVYRNIKRYGIAVTLNRLIRKSKGEIIGVVSSSDVLHRNRIKRQISYFLNNPGVVALGTQCTFVNKKNIKIGKSDFPLQNSSIYSTSPLHGLSMQFETVLINRNLLPKDILKFKASSVPFVYSDFLIKLLPYGKFENLGSFLHRHRQNPQTYLSDLKKNIFSLIKLWIRSTALYDYQPSLRLFFSSFFRTNLRV